MSDVTDLSIFENSKRTADKQESHSLEAAKLLEYDLKKTLSGLADCLFGKGLCWGRKNGHFMGSWSGLGSVPKELELIQFQVQIWNWSGIGIERF